MTDEDDNVNFAFEHISASVPVQKQFKDIVRWKGTLNARFLVLTDAPVHTDFLEKGLVIDREGEIENAIGPILDRVFDEDRDFVIASCCVGWKRNAYRRTPTAPELEVSIPFVEDLILRMRRLKIIIAVGPYAAELCQRNFNVREMYLCSKDARLTDDHEPHPSIGTRNNNDKILNTVVRRQRSIRYMYTPPIFRKQDFIAFTEGCLWHLSKIREFNLVSEPFDVRSQQLGLPDSSRYIDYDRFKNMMHDSFRAVASCRHTGEPTREHPTSIMINALSDPYHMNPHGSKCITVFNIQYDNVRNYIYLYGSTPTGTPMHVTVRDAKFTFWIRPHIAFAAAPDLWVNRKTQRPLYPDDLDNLKQVIAAKCKYAFLRQSKNFNGDPFTLDVDNKIDMHDGAWATHSTEFIRCDVSHYAFIDAIVKCLRKVVDDYSKKNTINHKELTLREHYDTRLDFYQIFKPEKMFGEKYNVQMSQWHRLENCRLEAPAPVSPTIVLPHATHLRGFIDLPLIGNPITCLPPNDAIPLDYDNMTSSDIPPDVRGSFDIEVSKFGKDWGSALDSPIICICVCVRRHDQRTSKFWPGSFIPVDGYEYFVFTLGTTTTTTTDETLRGQEHLFQFAREDDMLRSYFYFYSLLKPRYYASHNGKAYDIPFILNRAKIIGVDIPSMGYDPHQATRLVQTQFQSRAFGEKTVTSIEGEMGIDQIDTCELLMREKKLRSYKLGAVAELYVGMTKNDMPYDAIMGHWRTSDHTRRVLIDYCIRDAQLPDQILTQGQWVTSALELSRASGGVSIAALNEKGMQEKVLGAVLQVFRKQNLQYIIRTNAHWSKQFNNEIVERWLVKDDENPRAKKDAEDENEVVFREAQGQKRQRTASSSITSYFQPTTDEGGGPPKRMAASLSKPVQLSKKERQAQAQAAMAKAKNARAGDARKADYQGAVVMDVGKGWFFERPLACLDFAALYPSIMMSENHGPNTKVYSDEMAERGINECDCYKMPDFQVKNPRTGKQVDIFFLKPEVEKGVYAVVEIYLVALRGAAKREMAKYEHQFLNDNVTPNPNYDRDKFNIYNQRQNNLKVYANSLYGTMGATGILSDKDIAGSVTAVGRYSIYKVRRLAEEEFGGVCRGGDTDSVFMEFPGLPKGHYEKKWAEACARTDNETRPAEFPGVPDGWYRMNTVEEIEEFAIECLVPLVNKMFRAPMKIEYEKAMCCAICIAKKRYIYIMCERGKKPYIAFKGIEVVRRDSLPFLTKLMKQVFNVLMKMRTAEMSDEEYLQSIEMGKQAACDMIREQARILANGKVSVQDLILSKLRSREYYANETQEHLTVVRKLEERGLDAPSVGSRVYFVYTHQADGQKAITKSAKKNSGELKGSLIADDPEWVIHNRIPINYLYYFEHKFKEPILRIMRYFLEKEMVAAVLKRKRAERASSAKIEAFIGSKRQRVEEDNEDLTVTLKELTEETDRYLFGTASKRSLDHKKLQSRYASLRGGVISSAFVDRSNSASIAHFAQKEGRRIDHLKVEYDIQSEYEILEKETQKHTELKRKYDAAMHDCRSCLKIRPDEAVACTSTDCSKYLPRVMLTGDVKHSRENLDTLVADIEQMSLCDAVLLDDDN